MSGIVWLASYPKSGNTWTRIFLTNYWRNSDTPAEINDLDRTPIASSREIFDDEIGVESGDLTLDEIDYYRPYFYQKFAQLNDVTKYMKIHDAFTYLPDGRPLFPPEATKCVVYIIRNPLDVAVSYANHNASGVDQAVKLMGDNTHGLCTTKKTITNQLRQQLMSWSNHVLSWVDSDEDMRIHVMRYEDMIEKPLETFTELVNFVEEPEEDEPERIKRAIEFSSFENLRGQEDEDGFREKNPRSPVFFRKGKTGTWREDLSEELANQIMEDHHEVMLRFGYITEKAEIVY